MKLFKIRKDKEDEDLYLAREKDSVNPFMTEADII